MFELVSEYAPAGDQPQAIAKLTEGVLAGEEHQVLLGVSGTSRAFPDHRCDQAEHSPSF